MQSQSKKVHAHGYMLSNKNEALNHGPRMDLEEQKGSSLDARKLDVKNQRSTGKATPRRLAEGELCGDPDSPLLAQGHEHHDLGQSLDVEVLYDELGGFSSQLRGKDELTVRFPTGILKGHRRLRFHLERFEPRLAGRQHFPRDARGRSRSISGRGLDVGRRRRRRDAPLDVDELDVEDQQAAGAAVIRVLAVGHARGDPESELGTRTHELETLRPTLNDLPNAEIRWLPSLHAGVEHFPV
mmetsp:Transcript_59657/g.193224  ORF Transcript_59657/g.193224 Transcript_59657/m.193224 type:complete len:241 (-) Transcript_59657:513-1235(-)